MANIGTTLRAARVKRGLTIEQAAQDTRISRKFLEAIEAEDFNALPAPVYVRGFLRSYANYLRIDAAPLLEQVAEVLDRPISGPDAFVGGPKQGRGGNRGTSDPWRRRGVAPQPNRPPDRMPPPEPSPGDVPANATEDWDDAPEEFDDSIRARNLRLRESFGDAANLERPRGVVPNPPPPSQFREQRVRRERIPLPLPLPRQAFPPRPGSEPEYEDEAAEGGDEYYVDEQAAPPTRFVPPMAGFEPDEEDLVSTRSARRREAGVMRERSAAGGGGIPPMLLAIAGGGFIVAVFAGLLFLLFRTNGGDNNPAEVIGRETPTVAIQTAIVVGSPTVRPTGSPSVTGTVTGTVSGTPSVSATATPATGTPQPTATPGGNATFTPTPGAPTATATPSIEPTATPVPPTPTATLAPPTATPVPPTATPTPPPHAFGYGECAGGNCGQSPYLVICAPDGWFVDVWKDYLNPGWPTRVVQRAFEAASACP